MIHGDVFRPPNFLNVFVAMIGSGAQIFSTVLVLLLCVLLEAFRVTKRGALLTAMIVIYAVCGVFGGMVAGRLYKQLRGKSWVWNTVLTASMFPVPLGLVFMWVNSVAWNFSSTAALPLTTTLVSWKLLFCEQISRNVAFFSDFFCLILKTDFVIFFFFADHCGDIGVCSLPRRDSRCSGWSQHHRRVQPSVPHQQGSS